MLGDERPIVVSTAGRFRRYPPDGKRAGERRSRTRKGSAVRPFSKRDLPYRSRGIFYLRLSGVHRVAHRGKQRETGMGLLSPRQGCISV